MRKLQAFAAQEKRLLTTFAISGAISISLIQLHSSTCGSDFYSQCSNTQLKVLYYPAAVLFGLFLVLAIVVIYKLLKALSQSS